MTTTAAASRPFSPPVSEPRELILIGKDGVRASVPLAIATEASYVLRELIDVELLNNTSKQDNNNNKNNNQLGSRKEAADVRIVPDLMDFFPSAAVPQNQDHSTDSMALASYGEHSPPTVSSSKDGNIMDELFSDDTAPRLASASADTLQQGNSAPARHGNNNNNNNNMSASDVPAEPVELSFPYFNGDILKRVCKHMSYRFRMSSFGATDGFYRVYPIRTNDIPKPMTLPLLEYLDVTDRNFIQDWDELTTVMMVKVATLLNYEELLSLASAKLASYLCEKNVEGIRSLLGAESDFSAAEEAELRKEQIGELPR